MEIICGLASSPEEVAEAVELITAIYEKSGYVRPGESSGISRFLSSPATVTFTAHITQGLAGTISVVADSREGLPMDSIFADKLEPFRAQGLRIAEVGQFAIDRDRLIAAQGMNPREASDRVGSLQLFKLVLHYGLAGDFDLYCITVNPKHEAFYRFMGFEIFAETRDYPSVENAPAVPMKLDLRKLKTDHGEKKTKGLLAELLSSAPDETVLTQALARAASRDS